MYASTWFTSLSIIANRVNNQICFSKRVQKLLAEKDAENITKATKLAVNIFATYLRGKKTREPNDKESLGRWLRF